MTESAIFDLSSKDKALWNDEHEFDSDLEDGESTETTNFESVHTNTYVIPEHHTGVNDPKDILVAESGSYTTFVRCFFVATDFSDYLYSWTSLLFSMYTEEISFAPLRSQGLDVRATGIENLTKEYPHEPKPCSPKSLYALAYKVC